MALQWYPGHMTKARRGMQEQMKLMDLVIELVDARLPQGSRNPDIDRLGQGKARLILLNKADLADPQGNAQWKRWFASQGILAVEMDARRGAGIQTIQAAIAEACKEKLQRDRKRGIQNRPVRAMVAGIPNVGKSTFINTLAGRACAKTGNRPGVTKGQQWIRLNRQVELLDTPGILWPKFEDQETALKLAMIGSIKDEILQQEEVAAALLQVLRGKEALKQRYGLEAQEDSQDCLEGIAQCRHCLLPGGRLDTEKAARILLEDFRSGRLGGITLEYPTRDGMEV